MNNQDDEYRIYNDGQSLKTKKRFFGYSPILKTELLEAQSRATSSAHAARILGVVYKTYKKYCNLYEVPHIIERKQVKGGASKITSQSEQKLNEVLEGEYPTYTPKLLKDRLVSGRYINPECSNCGFCERRIGDNKIPLLLDFIDGNKRNHKWENLRLLCYNCYFLLVGNIHGRKPNIENEIKSKNDNEEIDLSLL